MTFGVPAALWLLLALPVVVLLYLLRARRQDTMISSILLWRRARHDLLVRQPLRRLERTLLLLLQLLAVLCAALAVAQPRLAVPGRHGAATIFVMDTSVSMQATDIAPTRFDAARQQALVLASASAGPVMVIETSPQPRVVMPFGDRTEARHVLTGLHPTDAPGNLDAAVGLALGQRPSQGDAEIVVFTDRATSQLTGVTYRVIGEAARNLSIVGLHTDSTADGARVVVQVKNWGASPERVPVIFALNDARVFERIVSVGPAQISSITGTIHGRGILRVEIVADDPLPADNVAYGIIGTPPPRVVVIGESDRALDQALAALPLQYAPTARVTPAQFAAADVVVLNGTAPVALPPGNYLMLGTTATNLPVRTEGEIRGPQILRWSRTHPVMRYVDLTGVQIEGALALRPTGGEVLAEGEAPLIWSYEGAGIRAIVVAFTPKQSDLPVMVAYPIFLSNAIAWLAERDLTFHAGDPLIQSARGFSEAVLLDPSGGRRVLRAIDGRFVVPALNRIGIHTLQVGDQTRRFAVNPAPEGSPIGPIGRDTTAVAAGVLQTRVIGGWPLLLSLTLAMLAAEWFLWVRGLPRTDLGRARVTAKR